MIRDLINYSKEIPLDIREETPPKHQDEVAIHDISFSNALGGRVKAFLVVPKKEGPFPAIEFIHWLETEAENSNRTQFLPAAIELGAKGFLSILPDTFWATTPEEFKKVGKLPWKTEYDHDRDLCVKQITELLRTHDLILARPDVDKDRIGFVGHDFGAMYGSVLPSLVSDHKAFVLMACTIRFSDWFKFGSDLETTIFEQYVKAMDVFDPINHISNAAPAPILFQFADEDFYVPKEVANQYYEAATEPKELRWYKADHSMNDQTFQDMKDWIQEMV
ncbi:MAG: dienelactone hydrolase family protein [Candidatus Hodarchaeales archaeon]